MNENLWYIFSLEHGGWWRANWNGYTEKKENAGLYSYEDALKIVRSANMYTGDIPNESMIQA